MVTSRRFTYWRLPLLLLCLGCAGLFQAEPQPKRIVFFGDSITQLGDSSGGYITIVRDSLASAGSPYEAVGAGISGNKVTDLARRLQNDVLDRKPAIVVIYIGINDVWHYQFAERGLSGTPKDSFFTILSRIVRTIRDAGAQVILCTPSVIGEKKNGANRWDAMLDEYSELSRRVAREQEVRLLDLRSKFTGYLAGHNPDDLTKGILTYDGVHLSANGNRFVAEAMMEALAPYGVFVPPK